ncbi:MAG: hypothetical protein ACI4EA_03385, partial [Candidatus Ornithomonoglobus sp.]
DFTNSDAKSYITDEYTSVVPDSTPYFAPASKFYLFDAIDTYGPVTLRIYYRGYIDVIPKTAAEAQPAVQAAAEEAVTEEAAEEAEEEIVEVVTEESAAEADPEAN